MERISPGLNFSPGWDFQPGFTNRAKIFSPGSNSEKPGLKSELERAQWLCFQWNKMAVSHFSPQFQISARAKTSHVIATKFQPGGRAETRHVIGPLTNRLWNDKDNSFSFPDLQWRTSKPNPHYAFYMTLAFRVRETNSPRTKLTRISQSAFAF